MLNVTRHTPLGEMQVYMVWGTFCENHKLQGGNWHESLCVTAKVRGYVLGTRNQHGRITVFQVLAVKF